MTDPAIKVVDTYLRGLRKLVGLSEDVAALEAAVAEREADALTEILAQVRPLLPALARPVSVKEPWLPPTAPDTTWSEPAVVLVESFQQDQGPHGHVARSGRLLLLTTEGRLVEVALRGAWTEGKGGVVTNATWRVEARERAATPELARANLRPILSGLLDALRDALVKGRAERATLTQRLDLLAEVDETLRRRKTARTPRPPSSDAGDLPTGGGAAPGAEGGAAVAP